MARWPSGRALDSGARGRGFDPHSGRRVVSLSKIQGLFSHKILCLFFIELDGKYLCSNTADKTCMVPYYPQP